MAMKWTEEQQKVIDVRGRNLLVSAAAGSGKTAVLVARIIAMITAENPIDIDRLLIVTFTNAAAAEMRERIQAAIEQQLEKEPENEHLQRQQTLIHTAPITTIDSFCLRVVKEHFDSIGLDPTFRIADEGEKKLLKSDVAERLLEEYYQSGKDEFFSFVESYSTGKTDEALEEMILKLYEFSMGYPDSEEWLLKCLKTYEIEDMEAFSRTECMASLLEYLRAMAKDMCKRAEKALSICQEETGPYMYAPMLSSDLEQIEKLLQADSYEEFGEAITGIVFARLSSKKDGTVEEEKKETVKWLRDTLKADIKEIEKQFYFQTPAEMLEDIRAMEPDVKMLVELTLEFGRRFREKKREKNVLDFHDIEHFALDILTERGEDGRRIPALSADEYSEDFEEIMIDEYQDSNYVQEAILTSVSKNRFGTKNNIFMVGDVKQSIYKFRLARPELFMEKYRTYTEEDSDRQKIDLFKNFRSREEVLFSINDIFRRVMTKGLGKIEYDDRAALYPGAAFEEKEAAQEDNKTELWLIEKEAKGADGEDFTSIELEAKAIAAKIRRLTSKEDGLQIWDKEKEAYRTASYQDITILLRTVSGWADTIVNVLMEEGIPAYAQSQSGYFTALEVQTVLNLLRIIDNPHQDIPFTGILRSPLLSLNSNELAEIRLASPEESMWAAAGYYKNEGENEALRERLSYFLGLLEEFRSMVPYTPIHDLLRYVLKRTGYGDFTAAMPAGKKRLMNLEMLMEKAVVYENTSYCGLFHFIRYIEKLQKYDVDFGEGSTVSENDDTIRIMSIHKSKGLEFPIVFLAGMGKRFNQQDTTERIVIHPDLGIGGDYIDYEKRIRSVTLIKKILQKNMRLENLSEEMRVLYVALTRAKEKLIMTGTAANVQKSLERWKREGEKEGELLYSVLTGAACYFDWVIPAYSQNSVRLQFLAPEDIITEEMLRQNERILKKEGLLNWDSGRIYDRLLREEIEKRFSFQYPYLPEISLYSKTSVSELKRREQLNEPEEESSMLLLPETEPIVPRFVGGEKEQTGTALGNSYHLFLEYLPLFDSRISASLEDYKSRLVEKGVLSLEEASFISLKKIKAFLESPLAGRMRCAEREKKLFRERQFMTGMPAKELYPGSESDEMILMQGIIDAYFEEDGGLILLDYKTDKAETVEMLKKRYHTQFHFYRKALSQMTGMQVRESLLYSFSLNACICMD